MTAQNLSQNIVDDIVASARSGVLAKPSISSLLKWLENDEDELLRAWEEFGELVVVNWAEFTQEFANDAYVADELGVTPSSLTDEQRVETFNQCLDSVMGDPSSSKAFTVHLKPLVARSGVRATAAVLAQLEGYSQVLTFLGTYPTDEEAVAALPSLGFQAVNSYPTRELILRSWNASKVNRESREYVFPDIGSAEIAWIGRRFMFIEINPDEPFVGADFDTEYAQPNFNYLLLDGLECAEIGWARTTDGSSLECGLLDVPGAHHVANFGAAARLLGRQWEALKREMAR